MKIVLIFSFLIFSMFGPNGLATPMADECCAQEFHGAPDLHESSDAHTEQEQNDCCDKSECGICHSTIFSQASNTDYAYPSFATIKIIKPSICPEPVFLASPLRPPIS